MKTTFVDVGGPSEWQELRERSRRLPVLLFKHDPPCSISRMAHRQLSTLGGEIPTLDVARAHALSLAVAEETGIVHESPQVLVLRNGEVAWSASHFAITADAVEKAIANAG